jgi:large subunit ribosomal protein L21
MYAIIKAGGKQYRVSPGDVIRVENIEGEAGQVVSFPALAVANDGADLKTGADAGKVAATIVNQGKSKKVIIFKFKRKKQYKRKNGHRQGFTAVKIGDITAA